MKTQIRSKFSLSQGFKVLLPLAPILLVLLLLIFPTPAQPPLAGSTVGGSLRNAATATYSQLNALRINVDNWSRRANAGIYTDAYFRQDYANAQSQFVALRTQFNYMAELALQLGRPRAANAVAELDAGLDIIVELFVFLEEQYSAGVLDRQTVVRTTQIFQRAIREWEQELRKNSSRMGLVW